MPQPHASQIIRRFRAGAQPADYPVLAYALAVLVAIVWRREAVPLWGLHAGVHAAVIVGVALTACLCGGAERRAVRLWRNWDALVYIVVLFVMSTQLVHRVNPNDVDALLIRWDRAIGGVAVLQWTQTWSTPLLDEVAKVSWVAYYFLPLLPAVALYRRKELDSFLESKTIFVISWMVAFAFYFAMPARGPLHFKEELGLADPSGGVAVAGTLKDVVGVLEGREARDTFPSGHVMIGAAVILICLRNRLWKTSAVAVPLSAVMVVSTIYLRYHYVVDVLAGFLLLVPIAWGTIAWFRRKLEREIG